MLNDNRSDDEAFAKYGADLHHAVSEAIRPWLRGSVAPLIPEIDAALDDVLLDIARNVEEAIRVLVDADVDAPLSGPLERIRQAVTPLNSALAERGAPQPQRNPLDVEMRPHDIYELGPMTFRDLSDDVHDAGIAWGAAKAHMHLRRNRG